MSFIPKTTDYKLSPYTGLTRQSWLEACQWILDGIFNNIKNFEDPVVMPRVETEITYPHKKSPEGLYKAEQKAQAFEGLTRSLFFASALLCNQKDAKAGGYSLSEYYKNQILRSCTKGDSLYIGTYQELCTMSETTNKFRAFQQTVETCALVIGLWVSKEVIWDTYTKEQKDTIAAFLDSYARAPTVPQNWRLFNMLDMAFLHMNGYAIDEEIMYEHATEILAYYSGDGWYRDGQCFDYYSVWAFNFYAPLWNQWYGYDNMKDIALQFEHNTNQLMKTYPDMFDQDGYTLMWGRSNIYRNASTSAFDGAMLLNNPKLDYGLARRICSGSLLQFFSRDDTFVNGIPTLGFYSQFAPLVQGYSCAESPFWMGKAFLCLHFPKDHPFWTTPESNGTWNRLKDKQIKTTALNGSALCFTNHKANGTTILRTGKVTKNTSDKHGMDNYGKLCYNTKYPWDSCSCSMEYILHDETEGYNSIANKVIWCKTEDDILYRRQFFDYRISEETHWMQALNLADFAIPYGILRADKIRLYRCPTTITLGSFGFPDNNTTVIQKSKGSFKAIIVKGYDSQNKQKQMAMTIYDGFDSIDIKKSTGTNPDSQNSIIICATGLRKKLYGGFAKKILISQVITKEDHTDFTDDDLFVITDIKYNDQKNCGAYGDIILTLNDGSTKTINFNGIESYI